MVRPLLVAVILVSFGCGNDAPAVDASVMTPDAGLGDFATKGGVWGGNGGCNLDELGIVLHDGYFTADLGNPADHIDFTVTADPRKAEGTGIATLNTETNSWNCELFCEAADTLILTCEPDNVVGVQGCTETFAPF